MRIIKLGLISAVVFFVMITGFSLFIPSHIRLSKAVDINAPNDSILRELSNPENWKRWYPGADSGQLYIIDGKIKGVTTGADQALIITSVTDSGVTTENVGKAAKRGTSGWNLYKAATPNTITVQWYMDFHLRWYPWEKFSSLLLEKRYGPVMEKGLERLKARFTQPAP